MSKTVKALTRFGERIERHLNPDESDDDFDTKRSGSPANFRAHSTKREDNRSSRDGFPLAMPHRRTYSDDNIAGNPNYSSFRNYRQNPYPNPLFDGIDRPQYGTGLGSTSMPYPPILNGPSAYTPAYTPAYPPSAASFNNYGQSSQSFGSLPSSSVAYAPEYYIAERRQIDLIPAPRPQIIQQPVPVPVPIDRPVPVPVPVPTPVPVDRPYPVAVPVSMPPPSPPPQQQMPQQSTICVPVTCYVPVNVPVPSPPPSPVIFENSVTHTQRWITGSPVMGTNPYTVPVNRSFMY